MFPPAARAAPPARARGSADVSRASRIMGAVRVTPANPLHSFPFWASTTAADWEAFTEGLRPPAWQRDAACLEHPEVEFFPDRGVSTAAAKAVCAGCLVREDCLAYALDNGIKHGIFGGTSERERRRLRGWDQPADARAIA